MISFDLHFDKRNQISVISSSESRDQIRRRFPKALIIGSMKSGTGALRTFLTLHPDIVSTEGLAEETGYFMKNDLYNRGPEWYLSLMKPSKPYEITIEKSIYFGENIKSPERIYKFNNTIKLILILRNPVMRLISDYAREKHSKEHTPSVEELIFNPKTVNVREESGYVKRGNYYSHMLRWIKYFPLKQFLIIDGEAFARNPLPGLKQAEAFLGVSHKLDKNIFIYKKKKGFYCYKRKDKTECMPHFKGRKHPYIKNKTLQRLQSYYRPLNQKLFTLLRRDFIKDWNNVHLHEYNKGSVKEI